MTWNEVIMYFIETVLKLLVVAVIPYLASLVRAKLKNDTQIKYLDRFEKLVRDAVDQVQQTYVENMKAEDLFDKNAQIEAFEMVKATVMSTMNSEMMDIVLQAVGDFDEYIRNLIESEVFAIKQNSGTALDVLENVDEAVAE